MRCKNKGILSGRDRKVEVFNIWITRSPSYNTSLVFLSRKRRALGLCPTVGMLQGCHLSCGFLRVVQNQAFPSPQMKAFLSGFKQKWQPQPRSLQKETVEGNGERTVWEHTDWCHKSPSSSFCSAENITIGTSGQKL